MDEPTYMAYTTTELESVNDPLFRAQRIAVRLGMMTLAAGLADLRRPITARLRGDSDGVKTHGGSDDN